MKILSKPQKAPGIGAPYKKVSRSNHEEGSVISVLGREIGGKKLTIIAGPCSVESEMQICQIAEEVKSGGASFLRGGAFKPRTSPYSFQGLLYDGLHYLLEAKRKSGLPIVSEIMSIRDIPFFSEHIDIIQVGARNMQNFDLLNELGKLKTPILLKRGQSATLYEWLMSAEYIMAKGNENIILCERGIRTFETYTRNTLDLSAVPALKALTHLPVLVDPSHAAGKYWMVPPLAKAAIASGADGLLLEVHNHPSSALSDGPQSLKPLLFLELMEELKALAPVLGREL